MAPCDVHLERVMGIEIGAEYFELRIVFFRQIAKCGPQMILLTLACL